MENKPTNSIVKSKLNKPKSAPRGRFIIPSFYNEQGDLKRLIQDYTSFDQVSRFIPKSQRAFVEKLDGLTKKLVSGELSGPGMPYQQYIGGGVVEKAYADVDKSSIELYVVFPDKLSEITSPDTLNLRIDNHFFKNRLIDFTNLTFPAFESSPKDSYVRYLKFDLPDTSKSSGSFANILSKVSRKEEQNSTVASSGVSVYFLEQKPFDWYTQR